MTEAKNQANVRNQGRGIVFPLSIRKEIKTSKLEKKLKQHNTSFKHLLRGLFNLLIVFK